jgi:hypothetical protein
VEAIPAVGSVVDPKLLETHAATLDALARECTDAGKDMVKAIAARQRQLRETLAKWPAKMTVQEFKGHYRELVGKRAALSGALTSSSYYNYGYGEPKKLRAFTLESEDFGGLYLYCLRAEPWCAKLFDSLKSGSSLNAKVVVENSKRYYQSDTSDMALLLSAQGTAD